MSFNPVENAFLGRAIKELEPTWLKVYGPLMTGRFDLGHPYITFMVVSECPDSGKLTVAARDLEGRLIKNSEGRDVPDPKITPVDCYNLIRHGEDLATAVARVFLGSDTPYFTIPDNGRGNDRYTGAPQYQY